MAEPLPSPIPRALQQRLRALLLAAPVLAALVLAAVLLLTPAPLPPAPRPPGPPEAGLIPLFRPAPAMAATDLPSPAGPVPGTPGAAAPAPVVEQLRLRVPAGAVEAWLEAERGSWGPWLARQAGFLDRQLLWDAERQEATLLIRWASRAQWQAISAEEVARVQARFEALARQATGIPQGNPFPLVFEGALQPL